MGDLFGHLEVIAWDERGMRGVTQNGRVVEITLSALVDGQYIATIPVHGRDVVTRRAGKDLHAVRAAAEKAVKDTA